MRIKETIIEKAVVFVNETDELNHVLTVNQKFLFLVAMLDDNYSSAQNVKKKKKRSFLQRQKRFAKQGNFGRGSQLSSDMYEYFINIMKVMNSKKDDEEEMSVLASNVYQELEGKEAEYCCNQIVSRVVENLLPYSSHEEFAKFIEKFSENLRPIFSDPFGSHVLQQTLIVSYLKYQKLVSEQGDEKLYSQFYNYILKISNFIFNNLEDFVWDVYSNMVTRTAFNILSGNPVKGEVKASGTEEQGDESGDKNIPPEFESLLKKFAKRICVWPQFNDLCNQPVNSSFLQSLLMASRNTEENSAIVNKIILFYENTPVDLTDEKNEPFARLVEVMLNIVDEDTFKRVYKLIFKQNLCELAKSKSGNFAVQKLITNCGSKKIFEKIFAKLEGEMEEVLKLKHTGVLLVLVKKCHSLEILQGECMAMLTRIFDVKDVKEMVPLVLSLSRREDFNFESSPSITLHGALIVQELLNFKKPINVVNSILELAEQKLVKIFSDPKGSHIADAFVRSPFIGEKSRDKLFKKLKGHYLELATSKHGSRALDAIWSVISIQNKVTLAEELKLKQSELCFDVYGRGFARKIHLDNFRRNKDEWIKIQKSSATAEKYFADIIPKKKQKTG